MACSERLNLDLNSSSSDTKACVLDPTSSSAPLLAHKGLQLLAINVKILPPKLAC